MKICVLEHPRIASEKRFNDIANTPLWSCLMGGYAASSLENAGFDTFFADDSFAGCTFENTLHKLGMLEPDLLCVNSVYFWEHTPRFFEFLAQLKNNGFSGHINLFGFFPTLMYRQIFKAFDVVDSIAVGEFEHTLKELASALDKEASIESILGLALKSCLQNTENKLRPPKKDPDCFTFPKRVSFQGTVTILASRGCYNHCSFCTVPSFYNQGALWRGRSPENIVEEMAELVGQGAKEFYFVDPNFIGPGKAGKKRILKLMELMRPMDIAFGMETRPQDLDDEILQSLVASGFNSLLMGVESGSDRVLESINKSSDPALSCDAIKLCRKYGIEPEIGFLMFVPDSSVADLRDNINFLMKNNLLDRLAGTANLLCHCQIVLGGTSGYQLFENQGRLEKSGLFGFEGEVLFADPGVKWICELVVFACHTVLRSMSDKSSPVFWKNRYNEVFFRINAYLIELFFSLLLKAEKNGAQDNKNKMESVISLEIDRILSMKKRGNAPIEHSRKFAGC
ncbi:MAG: B12-binding domain-containing radical SAM protein [Desulfobacula sp.]|nr:B12-binding domain-containing radical SAM protein [Desulfobacula sp.]